MASPDSIVPDPSNPQSFNRYSYSRNNPLRYIDPTGHKECEYHDDCSELPPTKQYDLTGWLPGAMRRGAQAEELRPMRQLISNPIEDYDKWSWDSNIEFYSLAGAYLQELGTTFYNLNTGYGQWDVKREIEEIIGQGVTLCSGNTCRWVDYSVPGNILFGYVAASVGITPDVARQAGGLLEIKEGTAIWANRSNDFEDPYDSAAVNFGFQLYETYGSDITEEEFTAALTIDILDSFQPIPDTFTPPSSPIPQSNFYSADAFDCFPQNGCTPR